VDLRAEYEFFSFDPIQADLLFESCKSDFIESEAIVIEHFDLDQPPERITLKGLVDLGPSILPKLLIHDDHIFRPMTSTLATFTYVCLFPIWAQQFDKLKRALTCTALLWWMYSIWYQLLHLRCLNFIESWSFVFDKLLRALTSFDFGRNVAFDMEWLMLHGPYLSEAIA